MSRAECLKQQGNFSLFNACVVIRFNLVFGNVALLMFTVTAWTPITHSFPPVVVAMITTK